MTPIFSLLKTRQNETCSVRGPRDWLSQCVVVPRDTCDTVDEREKERVRDGQGVGVREDIRFLVKDLSVHPFLFKDFEIKTQGKLNVVLKSHERGT